MANKRSVQVASVENSGPNTLVSFLRNAGSGCKALDLAVSFVSSAGLESLLYLLKKIAMKGKVRLLTGLYQGITEPKALRTLLRVQHDTSGRLEVRLSLAPHFHWKAYYLLRPESAHAVIGSSNLTDDGLRKSGELNVVLTLSRTSKDFKDVHRLFEREWTSRSTRFSDDAITAYEKWRVQEDVGHKHLSVPLREILGRSRRASISARTKTETRYWRFYIDGVLSDDADSLLGEVTDWDRRGWWYSSWRRDDPLRPQ